MAMTALSQKNNLEQLQYLLTLAQQSVDGNELEQLKKNAQQIVDVFCENSKRLTDVIKAQKFLQQINSIITEQEKKNLLDAKLDKVYKNIISLIQNNIKTLLPLLKRPENNYLTILQEILTKPSNVEAVLQKYAIKDPYLTDKFVDISSALIGLTPVDHEIIINEIKFFLTQNLLPSTEKDCIVDSEVAEEKGTYLEFA